MQGRAEELGQNKRYRSRFDVATARAVASLPVLLEYVVPFLTIGGTALLPKGLEITEELRLGRRAAAILGAEIVSATAATVHYDEVGCGSEDFTNGSRIPAPSGHPQPRSARRKVLIIHGYTDLLSQREAPRRLLGISG